LLTPIANKFLPSGKSTAHWSI